MNNTRVLLARCTLDTVADGLSIAPSVFHDRVPTACPATLQISRIRNFYMRKVKFSQATFHDKLTAILEEFPKLDVSPLRARFQRL